MGKLKNLRPQLSPLPSRLGYGAGKTYDQRRGSASARLYSGKWAKASRSYRAANPLCIGCQAVGRDTAAELTDHVIPHKGDQALFWNKANWQSSCTQHHSIVKQRLELLFDRGEIMAEDLELGSAIARKLTFELMDI